MTETTVAQLNKQAAEIIRTNTIKGILSYQKDSVSMAAIIEQNQDEIIASAKIGGISFSEAVRKFFEFMQGNLSLYQCTALSIYETLKSSIELGLIWDETAGEIWISDYICDETKQTKMTYIVGTKGLQKIAKRVANPPIHHFNTFMDKDTGDFVAEIYWENYPDKATHAIKFTDYQKYVASLKRSTYFHLKYPERMGQYLAMRELLRPMHLDWRISSEIIKQEKFEQGL